MPANAVRDLVPQIESLGFRTIWYPESLAGEVFVQGSLLLAAGCEIVAASGIANIWARDPVAMANGARGLAEAFPGRFLLGIGVSHAPSVALRGHQYDHPLSVMRSYLDRMRQAEYMGPPPPQDPPIVLAALGPRMLRLAAEHARGAHPYFVPVDHTSFARTHLGSRALLLPGQAVVLSADPAEARSIARERSQHYLSLDNYRNNLLRLGWSEADMAEGGSDALIDAVVAWGGVAAIQARVAAHLEAGADHVSVQVLNGPPDRFPMEEFRSLAPALLEL
jgi:probable F420-dependent oxidoreductase